MKTQSTSHPCACQKSTSALLLLIGCSFLTAVSKTHASDGTWIADANGSWTDETNWQNNIIADGAGNTASFGSTVTATRTVSLGADRTIGNIVFASSDQNMVMSGNTLIFDGDGDAPVFDVQNSLVRVTSTFAGTEGLVKNGEGILTVDMTSTSISGPIVVNEGQLRIQRNNILGEASSFEIKSGARMELSGGGRSATLALAEDASIFGSGTETSRITGTSASQVRMTGNNTIYQDGGGTLELTRLEIHGTGNEMTGGIINAISSSARGLLIGNNTSADFTISGGTWTSTGDTPDVLGANGATGTFNIEGGHYVNAGVLEFGINSDSHPGGVINIESGSATIGSLQYRAANTTGGQGILNLNGGTLTLGALVSQRGETREFNFNGGQLIADDDLDFPDSLTLNVRDGGAKIDTNGHSITVSSDLLQDGDGGLDKSGAGTLILSGANSYTGDTTVEAGTLALNGGSQASPIIVSDDALLGLTPGAPSVSSADLTLEPDARIRIIGTPTASSYVLFFTTGTIIGTPELENPIANYDLVVEDGNTILLVAQATPDQDYATWAANFPEADLSDPNADFNGNGITNEQARLFGLDPTDSAAVNPIIVPLDAATGTLSFTRRDPALTGAEYDVWFSTNLVVWEMDEDALLTPGTVDDEVETVAVQLSEDLLDEPRLFIRIGAEAPEPAEPLLDEGFETNDGGFTASTTGGTPWEWGIPDSPDQLGGSVTSGSNGSLRCWGTNLTGGYGPGTDTSLRSPVIDLTEVTEATLSFWKSIDADLGHTLTVNVIAADTDTLIANIIPATEDDDDSSSEWQLVGPVSLPAEAYGQPIRIEWHFTGNGDGTFNGVYLDDVLVLETTP